MNITETFILSSSVTDPLNTDPVDREVEIIHHLRIKILSYTPQLTETSRVLGELDW